MYNLWNYFTAIEDIWYPGAYMKSSWDNLISFDIKR
jgi:hypothetical protein